jgi:glycosyltransferase 2 family protein
MSRTLSTLARVSGGAMVLAAVVWQVGAGPFLDGVRTVDAISLGAAAGIAVVTTVCCAWRWSLVARGLGVEVPLRSAVAAYYRSQFLNTALPGGVLGDVHRGVRHGRDVGDVGKGLRAVGWERSAGQAVQAVLALAVLSTLPSPVRRPAAVGAAILVAAALVVVVVGRGLPPTGSSRWARGVRTAATDVRDGIAARGIWPGVVLASVAVVAGHAATFVIAARTAGVTASPVQLLAPTLLVLLAMGIPTNVGGWGPREGVAAWAFGTAGLGADLGVSTAVVYGVMALVANLPGAGVLVLSWARAWVGRTPGRAPVVTRDGTAGAVGPALGPLTTSYCPRVQ